MTPWTAHLAIHTGHTPFNCFYFQFSCCLVHRRAFLYYPNITFRGKPGPRILPTLLCTLLGGSIGCAVLFGAAFGLGTSPPLHSSAPPQHLKWAPFGVACEPYLPGILSGLLLLRRNLDHEAMPPLALKLISLFFNMLPGFNFLPRRLILITFSLEKPS